MPDPEDAGPVEQELPDQDLDVVTGGVPDTNVYGANGTFNLDPS